ncbi:carbonic anhydrase 14-like isoform X2 [Brienomyrus brachyistius]|uniref:carbonic anhydrase 14-like isoform X2 n=1 Tax=Brienomyrus brachyistius TaxID=42636 RepID=UPI0020B17B8D|nr:carbonic anhydrase 14-like isoform X2 [Brienomyrus brachyistius]
MEEGPLWVSEAAGLVSARREMAQWSKSFPDCGGVHQSPIDVETSAVHHDPSLMPVNVVDYHQPGHDPFILSNNGHTVKMSLPAWFQLGGLPWRFTAVQLHFHWGREWDGSGGLAGGSEHTVDGRRSAAELHVVHYNSDLYPNVSVAQSQRDGLVVLGVLIETGDDNNSAYENIFKYLEFIKYAGQQMPIPSFNVRSLLPTDLGRYFRYNGSLTTPPCYQSVLWTVFAEKVTVTRKQLKNLETVLFSNDGKDPKSVPLQDNYRTTQPLNHRVVLASFVPDSITSYTLGKLCAVVVGSLCGLMGLAMVIILLVKAMSSTSSWEALAAVRPAPSRRSKEHDKEQKQDTAFNTDPDPEKPEAPPKVEA